MFFEGSALPAHHYRANESLVIFKILYITLNMELQT